MRDRVIPAFGVQHVTDLLWATIAVAAATAVDWILQSFLPRENILLVFLLPVLFTAARYGLWPSLYASGLSWVSYNFFFTEPVFTMHVYSRSDIVTLLFFPVIALVTGNMAVRLKKQMADVEKAHFFAETEKLRSALLSSISHDLRTPLASIIGSATTLQDMRKTLSARAGEELLKNIHDEAERLNRFIQNLLDMTRLGHGGIKLKKEWVEFRDIMGRVLRRVEKEARFHKIEIERLPELATLYVDPVLMEQVFVNILDNAAKYAPPGSKIKITMAGKDNEAVISFIDQGPGIPEQHREQVFDMFFRTRSADAKVAGTGLGLAICRGLVEAHGGTIRADAGPEGKGTAIIITFPDFMAGKMAGLREVSYG